MSLYYEAASLLNAPGDGASLTNRIYAAKDLKNKPAHLYALCTEVVKWSLALSQVIERANILSIERKLTPTLALLLTHDLLLSKDGVAAPRYHVLRLAIERHRARLGAELTKARVKGGHLTLADWKAALEADGSGLDNVEGQAGEGRVRHPRWIRINTLRTTLALELSSTFSDYQSKTLAEVLKAAPTEKVLYRDEHIPNLVAVPDRTDLTASPAYTEGRVILQDKASCFPAYLLQPHRSDGDIIDACAAPGNKTTHLAALLREHLSQSPKTTATATATIFACERDKSRSLTLQKMLRTAGTTQDHIDDGSGGGHVQVKCLPNQDFLRLDPHDPRFRNVGALLLDPSCSGSGIVGRNDDENGDADPDSILSKLVLPRRDSPESSAPTSRATNKRKRAPVLTTPSAPVSAETTSASRKASDATVPEAQAPTATQHRPLAARLSALSAFQLALVRHAFSFPSARKVAYSTCSVHGAENEGVVVRALLSRVGRERGWRVARRAEQAVGMREWGVRGLRAVVDEYADADADAEGEMGLGEGEAAGVAEGCVRCRKGTGEGTMGFFAVLFVRDGEGGGETSEEVGATAGTDGEEDEWDGFSDSE